MTQPDTLAQKSHAKPLKIESARKGFVPNVVSNVGFLFLRVLVGLWYTPYLIDHLGIGVFGIISLAESVIAYLETFTFSFSSAVTRFLTVDLNRADVRAANAGDDGRRRRYWPAGRAADTAAMAAAGGKTAFPE